MTEIARPQVAYMPMIILNLLLLFTLSAFTQTPLTVTENPDGTVTIKNGLLGIVVPSSKNISQGKGVLGPIQSFILKDGSQPDKSPNFVVSQPLPAKATAEIRKTTDRVTCIFDYRFPGGQFYRCTLIVTKNSKTITVEEDSDYDLRYNIGLCEAPGFDRARYRGWNAVSPEYGYEPDGKAYREENSRQPLDATVDLDCSKPRKFPMMSNWDPAGGEINTGRYWQVYRNNGSPSENLFGIFQGQPSRLIGNRFVGVRLVTGPNPTQKPGLELEMELVRRGPDNSYVPRKRFQWCAYISTKADLLPANSFQPIGKEMNRVSGIASRVDSYCSKPLLINESFLRGACYQDEKTIKDMVDRVKAEAGYYDRMCRINPSFKPVLDIWKYRDSAVSSKKFILEGYEQVRNELVNGDGSHAFNLKYWMGGISFKSYTMRISAMFADPSIVLTAAEKDRMLAFLRLMARVQWDDDHVPFFDSSGINFGTANMSYQYRNNGRNFFALLFSQDPEFKERASHVLDETRKDLLKAIAENGISFASPHYTQATVDPILFSMLQLKTMGIKDLFAEQKTRLISFINFYTSLLTPPSVRFMGYRKLVSIGDGSEESAPTFALLAAGFQDIDPGLSNSMYAIFENGAPRQSLFGEMGLSVNIGNHKGEFKGGSANYPGYMSHARSGINTPMETAAWVINGEIYSDHRNQDRGEAVIYALGAPLSLSRSSFYTPHAPDARLRSLLVPEAMFPSWKGAQQPINGEDKMGDPWKKSSVTDYGKFPGFTYSMSAIEGEKKQWNRSFLMIHVDEKQPLFVFYDSTSEPAIWSMMFMSDDVIENSRTPIKTTARIHDGARKELPEATREKNLPPGWNSFSFKGQKWKTHPSGGINWDLYTYTGAPTSYTFSQWTNTWQNSQEVAEFQQTNGKPYEEMQQIMRWRSTKPFLAVITPFSKDGTALKSEIAGPGAIILKSIKRKYTIRSSYCIVDDNAEGKTILFLSEAATEAEGISCTGGNAAITIKGNEVRLRISGKSRKLKLTLPFEVNDSEGISKNTKGSALIEIQHTGNLDIGPEDKGYTEYVLTRK